MDGFDGGGAPIAADNDPVMGLIRAAQGKVA
jgi:hypothetical protein